MSIRDELILECQGRETVTRTASVQACWSVGLTTVPPRLEEPGIVLMIAARQGVARTDPVSMARWLIVLV